MSFKQFRARRDAAWRSGSGKYEFGSGNYGGLPKQQDSEAAGGQ